MGKLALVLALPFTMIYDVVIVPITLFTIVIIGPEAKIWPLTSQVVRALIND